MDFADEVRQYAKKIEVVKDHLTTEEATKTSLILPFLRLLGYDVFDPTEVTPEFIADVGIKKGEKVDYAIRIKGNPAILVEVKAFGDPLTEHDSQLFRYFAVTKARFAILTNGAFFKFFTDLHEPNKMDQLPFLEFDFLNIREPLIPELRKFHRDSFNSDALYSDAANLKYISLIRTVMDREISEPSSDFCRFFLREIQPNKSVTQSALDRFRPLIKRALTIYINDLLSEKLANAIASATGDTPQSAPPQEVSTLAAPKSEIVTTQEELEGFFIIKSIVRDTLASKRLSLKDNLTYAAVLVDGSTHKWICRLYLDGAQKAIVIPAEDKVERHVIKDLDELYQYRDELLATVRRLLEAKPARQNETSGPV